MINLLPQKEKEALTIKRKEKLVIVLGIIVLNFLVCFILVLAALKFYILGATRYEKVVLDSAEAKYQASGLSDMKDVIEKYNTSLTTVSDFYSKEIYFSDALKTILQIQIPNGLYFTNVSLVQDKQDHAVKVSVSGVSDTRDNLQTLQSSFENNKKIQNLYFPANDWIKPTNVDFYFTFDVSLP